jgi:hypothetical protein
MVFLSQYPLFCRRFLEFLRPPHNQIANVNFLLRPVVFAVSTEPVALVGCSLSRSVWSVFGGRRLHLAGKSLVWQGYLSVKDNFVLLQFSNVSLGFWFFGWEMEMELELE